MNFTFDWNESFLVLTAFVCLILFRMVPRRFHPMATFINWVFIIVFIETIDYTLGVNPYDLYDFLDGPGYQPTIALAHFLIYPSFAYFFVYFYDKWKLKDFFLIIYILAWTGISVFYEWLCLINNVLTYKDWNLLYSIPTYPAACVVTLLVFHFVKSNFNLRR